MRDILFICSFLFVSSAYAQNAVIQTGHSYDLQTDGVHYAAAVQNLVPGKNVTTQNCTWDYQVWTKGDGYVEGQYNPNHEEGTSLEDCLAKGEELRKKENDDEIEDLNQTAYLRTKSTTKFTTTQKIDDKQFNLVESVKDKIEKLRRDDKDVDVTMRQSASNVVVKLVENKYDASADGKLPKAIIDFNTPGTMTVTIPVNFKGVPSDAITPELLTAAIHSEGLRYGIIQIPGSTEVAKPGTPPMPGSTEPPKPANQPVVGQN